MESGVTVCQMVLKLQKQQEIQEYMVIAKEENADRTYAKLKRKYLALKAILQVAGVNLTDIDEIKE